MVVTQGPRPMPGGGGPGGGGMTRERMMNMSEADRNRMRDRFQNMSEAERDRFTQQMRERMGGSRGGDRGGVRGGCLFGRKCWTDAGAQDRRIRSTAHCWDVPTAMTKSANFSKQRMPIMSTLATMISCALEWRMISPAARSLHGSRAGWSSGPGPWGAGAFWVTRAEVIYGQPSTGK